MEIILVQCATESCGHSPFPMAGAFINRAKKTHETFCCPAGHKNYYAGKTEEEKTIERLKENNEYLQTEVKRLQRDRNIQSRTCPWPECGFIASSGTPWDRRALWSHMRQVHGMPALYQILAEAEMGKEG